MNDESGIFAGKSWLLFVRREVVVESEIGLQPIRAAREIQGENRPNPNLAHRQIVPGV